MREIRMSSLMSGDGRRGATPIGSATAPFLDSTMKARAVDQHGGMMPGQHRLRDQGEMRTHRLRADRLDHNRDPRVPLRAEGAEQPGQLEAAMHQRPWTAALLGPAPDHLALLANAGLVLHPHLDGARLGMLFGDLRQAFGKARLERRLCIWVRLVVLRSTHQLLQVQQMQLDAYRFGAHADAPGTLDQSNNVANPELGPAGLAARPAPSV